MAQMGEAGPMTFEEFVAAQLPALLRFAKVLCGDRGLAEDVAQEVMLRTQEKWARIAGLDKPQAYVRRMIVNEYLSWSRKWARVIPLAVVPDLPDAGRVPDPAADYADRELLVMELAKLPRRQRAALVLRYYGGLTDQEIAEELGCSNGTARSHISRALATLRVELADQAVVRNEVS
jgi:RNA polymerase sigma-70 factor (sigma-E family)